MESTPAPPPPRPPTALAAWFAVEGAGRLIAGVAAVSALAVALVAFRAAWTERATYDFLYWNLFLAWVPVGLALLAVRAAMAPRLRWLVALIGLAWLTFFPNAPYILTDLMHLRTTRGGPLWLDVLMVGAVALAGLFAGLASLRLVHGVVARLTRSAALGWVFASLACLGAGFGVYLGRFQRWNSWDILTRPTDLLSDALTTVTGPRAVAFTAIFGLLLLATYVALVAFGRPIRPAAPPPLTPPEPR